MLQLSDSANLFVSAESDNFYQHTAGLVILSADESADFCFEKLRSFIEARLGQIPQFRWKLKEVPFGLDLPYWVEDEKFDFDRHIHRIAVPAPGDIKALTELAAFLYSRRLDRSKPLWELWFIEGLPGRRFALLQKLHHCMMDGQGAQKIGEALCDFAPNPPPRAVPAGLSRARTGGAPGELELYARTVSNLAQFPLRSGRHVWSMLRPAIDLRASPRAQGKAAPQQAPALPCNGAIGTQRGFVCCSVALAGVKQVKNHFEVSINDVVLALTTTSMRNYLLQRGALPQQPVRVNMAVSLRKESDSATSNAITTVNIALPTNCAEPLARLRAIHEETDTAKQAARSGKSSVFELINSLPPFAVGLITRALTPEMVLSRMNCNFVVSNVKGSTEPMYLAGARIEAMYPISLLATGVGLNFTCVSYVDKIDFGITCDQELVPDAWLIADGMDAALREYLQLAGDTDTATRSRTRTVRAKPVRGSATTKVTLKRGKAAKS